MNGITVNQTAQPHRRRSRRSWLTRRARRLRARRGLTAIESMFLLSLIVIALLVAVQHLGSAVKSSYTTTDSAMKKVGL